MTQSERQSAKERLLGEIIRLIEDSPEFGVPEVRAIVGMGAKLVLPKTCWNYRGEVQPLRKMGREFSRRPVVLGVWDGFSSIDSDIIGARGPAVVFALRIARLRSPFESLSGKPVNDMGSNRKMKRRMARYRRTAAYFLVQLRAYEIKASEGRRGLRYALGNLVDLFG